MAHARITDDKFQIALAQRHRRRVNDPDYGEDSDPFAPDVETLREKIHGDAQPAVGAKFHDNAGEQHRTGSGRSDVTGWRPSVQRPDAGEHGKPEKQDRERPRLQCSVRRTIG